jgi:hypothetical protein
MLTPKETVDFSSWQRAGEVLEPNAQTAEALPLPPTRVAAQTIEDSNWLKRYLRGDFRVKPKSEKAACVSSYRRSNSSVWAFWGMMIGAALATGDPLLWEGDAIRINIINIVTQTLGFGAFGAFTASIRNWAGRKLP